MTKTTNYEISKKLAEIGFRAKAEKCWAKIRHSISSEFNLVNLDFAVPQNCDEWVLSYDGGTLLDALPKSIKYCGDTYYFWMTYSSSSGCYIVGYVRGQTRETELEKYSEENESLADTAGRMIILLYEKNLIKF